MFNTSTSFLIISPQPWDGIRVSKHNYARELARQGHTVFFLNPPTIDGKRGAISVQPCDIEGVKTVTYTPWFPYNIKFHFRTLFNCCMRKQAIMIQEAINSPLDIIWDFDNCYQFAKIRWFNANHHILHLVDQISDGLKVGNKGASLTLSVDPSFLNRVGVSKGHIIPHALNYEFSNKSRSVIKGDRVLKQCSPKTRKNEKRVRVGYVGNLEQLGLDWTTLEKIVIENPNVEFTFIGPNNLSASNEVRSQIPTSLSENCSNIEFTGKKTPQEIVALSNEIDIWLLCYDVKTSVNGHLNSHKMLEYMATGRTIISSQIAAYKDSDLVNMNGQASNETYPDFFKQGLFNLKSSNHINMQKRRAAFALEFSYEKNIERIATLLSEQS